MYSVLRGDCLFKGWRGEVRIFENRRTLFNIIPIMGKIYPDICKDALGIIHYFIISIYDIYKSA